MAARTFAQLVDDLRIESGASGRRITTVQGNLPAETERLKRWIGSAWNDIQVQHTDWRFLYEESSHILTVGANVLNQTEYAAGDVAEWMLNSFRISQPGAARKDSQSLRYIEYYEWRDLEGLDASRTGKPDSFTVDPNTEAIILSPTADDAYVLFYDYWRNPQVLAADADVPLMPGRYHELIVAWALRKYGFHEVASERLQQANDIVGRLFPALEIDQLPEVTLGTL